MEFSVAVLWDEEEEERKNGMDNECGQANNALSVYFSCEMQLMGRNAFGPQGLTEGKDGALDNSRSTLNSVTYHFESPDFGFKTEKLRLRHNRAGLLAAVQLTFFSHACTV